MSSKEAPHILTYNDMPPEMIEKIASNMSIQQLLDLRLTSHSNRAVADFQINKRHLELFGPTQKSITNKIKDLTLKLVFTKLRTCRLGDTKLAKDILTYGLGSVLGTDIYKRQRFVFVPAPEPDEDEDVIPQFVFIPIMYKLSIALPKIAKECRIATNHYISENFHGEKLQQALKAHVVSEWKDKYPTDITLPNPKEMICDYFFNKFYSGQKNKLRYQINITNGLLPNPLERLVRGADVFDPYMSAIVGVDHCLKNVRFIHELIDDDIRIDDNDRSILRKYMEYIGRSNLSSEMTERVLARYQK